MKTSALKTSKFLTKDDAGTGIRVTMRKLTEENVEMEGKPERMKWILHFDGDYKPLVLNSTNIASIERIHGDETDDWIGKQIILFNDENVSFGGEITGGVRVDINRTKRMLAAPTTKQAVKPTHNDPFLDDAGKFDEDQVPF